MWGFKENSKIKAVYNHWDSYPEVLGKWILNMVKKKSIEELKNWFKKIERGETDYVLELVNTEFPSWCEWAYIINFDSQTLDIYIRSRT
jgi:hypothetical protein